MSWITQSVFYHIYPLGFCGAPSHNDYGQPVNRIEKLIEWIPHLKQLQVNAVYLGPVFESSEHGYDTRDYYAIDRRLGDKTAFQRVCDALHENGIRIVLDGVFNHVGREFWAFQDVQRNGQSSPYCGWFHNLNFGGGSPMGDPFWYEGWGGHYNLVKLNLRNPDVVKHLLDAVGMWMDTFGIDGLRLDAADCVDLDFFRQLHTYCKNKRSDFWLMGEIIHGDYTRWAAPGLLDSVTNYECAKGLYSSHNDKNYFEIAHSLQRQFGNGGLYRSLTLYNFVDNHDVNRLASTVRNPKHLQNIYTLLYTMPGIPSVYYGSEWAVQGVKHNGSDAGLRPCLDLGQMQASNHPLADHLAVLGKLRHQLSALQEGAYEQLVVKNEQLAYKRTTPSQTVYVALNLAEQDAQLSFRAEGQRFTDLLSTKDSFVVENGNLNVSIPACSARILVETTHDMHDISEQTPPQPVELPQTKEVQLGRYCHFKGNEYKVIGISKHSETLEEYVVYQPLYGDGGLWIRPKAMFLEEVEKDGKRVPRFAWIAPN